MEEPPNRYKITKPSVKPSCNSVFEKVDDTMKAAGIDSMNSSHEVYNSLKESAKSNANVKTIVAEIGERFKTQGNRTPRASKTTNS